MLIEVLTIGDELLSGQVVDTNFAWLGERLWGLGWLLHRHTTVGDEPEAIAAALTEAAARSQVALVTGGLGPTLDDITLEAAARVFGLVLKLEPAALEAMRAFFQKFGRPMSPSNAKQALLPEGSVMIANPVGTAPGCRVAWRGCHFVFLPGVPKEMKAMYTAAVEPWLVTLAPEPPVFEMRGLRTFGLPEATLQEKLADLDLTDVDLAFRVHFPEILLRVTSRVRPVQRAQQRTAAVVAAIRERLGDVVYSDDAAMLPEVVGRLLRARKQTLATAESCTGGMVADLLTDVPGASDYFERGVVTYSNPSKIDLLGVPKKILEKHGAVSAETARAMAEGVKKISGTTYGLAVTGIAGPTGGTPEKPVGTVHIALATPVETWEKSYHFPRGRDWFKSLTAWTALDRLRRELLKG